MSPRHYAHATHAAPGLGFTATPCCGTEPRDLPRFHEVTPDLRAVTCPGNPVAPVRELIAITLASTLRPNASPARFLHHGDDDGHVYDDRCAMCQADISALAVNVATALTLAVPDADVANLSAVRPRWARKPPDVLRSPLRNLVQGVLASTPRTGQWTDGGFPGHGGPAGHDYHRRCALCARSVDVLAHAVEGALLHTVPPVFKRYAPRKRKRTTAPAPTTAA